ncbi:MAG: type II toxin-antitoxin system RelE/ParE family toxin [Gammaproteobacteria bacterium]|nr:type II toxin-antitoxin system RelE/ParE family toxin [Gammaproteobacteria bacterium]
MEVRWLATALRNLDDEAEFVAKDDPAAARRLVGRIRGAVENLKANPAMGRPGRIHGTRELVVPGTPYIVPYRVRPRLNRVEILRVFHTSRRLPERR